LVVLIAGVIVGLAFLAGVLIGGLHYAEAIAWLIVGAAIGWVLDRQGKKAVAVFVIAIVIVTLAWVAATATAPAVG
jgi:hypothetical protein